MMYDTGTYTLKSGRVIYAKGGVFGLGPVEEGYKGVLFGGYEGQLLDDQGHPYHLTHEERYEIAAEMIHRWLRWAEGD